MKSKIRFNDGGYEVEFKPHTWGQFAFTSHTSWSYPDQGFNKALREASPTPEEIVKAVNEHAALVAVAQAADLVGKANMRLLEAQRQGDKTAIGNATVDLYCELDRLAAVRSGSEVAK